MAWGRSRPWLVDAVAAEQARLADTLERVGPTGAAGPTWAGADLAKHFAMQLRHPWATAAFETLVPAIRYPVSAAVPGPLQRLSDRQHDSWDETIDRLHAPLPRPWGQDPVTAVRMAETWLHRQDVERADDAEPAALLEATRGLATLAARHDSRVLVRAGDDRLPTGWRGPTVTVTGPLPQVALYLAGRRNLAPDVTVDGPPRLVTRLSTVAL